MSCKLSLELVRLRRLRQDPDAPLATSASVELDVVDLSEGGTVLAHHVTRVVSESADPFFNDAIAIDATPQFLDAFERMPPPAAKPRPPAKPASKVPARRSLFGATKEKPEKEERPKVDCPLSVLVRVLDHNMSPPLLVALGRGALPAGETAKAELQIPLSVPEPEADGDEPYDDMTAGTAVFRYTVKAVRPHAPVNDVDADVVVKEVPHFDGTCSLIPAGRPLPTVFLWWHFLNDPAWRERFHGAVTQSYTHIVLQQAVDQRSAGRRRSTVAQQKALVSEVQATLEPLTMAKVITQHWGVKRSHQFFTKLRWTAERFMLGVTGAELVLPKTGDQEDKLLWKEHALMRGGSIAQSPTVQQALERLWAYFLVGDGDPQSPEPFPLQYQHRTAMATAVFTRAHCEVLQAALIAALDPALRGTDLPGQLAKADFEVDVLVNPLAAAVAQRAVERRESAAAPASDVGASTKSRPSSASLLVPPPETAPGQQARAWFDHVLGGFVTTWCDGFAEAEYVELLRALAPAIAVAREKSAHLAPTKAGRGGSEARSPRGKKKAAKRKATPRRKSPSGVRIM